MQINPVIKLAIPSRILIGFAMVHSISGCFTRFPGDPETRTDQHVTNDALFDADTVGADAAPERPVDALVQDALVQDAQLQDAQLQDAQLQDAQLQDAQLQDAQLQDAQLQDAQLQDAQLQDAQLQDAQLQDAQLQDAQLQDAQVQDAQPVDAQIQDAQPVDAQIQDAEPVDARIQDARPQDPDAADCALMGDEICNGLDDDCDGQIDEETDCGPWAEDACTAWIAQADNDQAPDEAAASWGACPAENSGESPNLACAGTRGDGEFRNIHLMGDVNDDDWFGVAFRCADAAAPELAAYVQRNCRFWLVNEDVYDGALIRDTMGRCPNVHQDLDGPARCVSTGGDGAFHRLFTEGDVDRNDAFGVAFRCHHPEQPERAAALQQQIEIFLGLRKNRNGHDGHDRWGDCPNSSLDDDGNDRCAGTDGDGRFHLIHGTSDLGTDGDDWMGIALKSR